MHKRNKNTFYCFSPPVMLATLAIEFFLAGYALWRYKLNSISRLITLMLICLGTFQTAEYFVCTGAGLATVEWSQLGFVAITALPPLGLHLMHKLAGKPVGGLVYAAYGTMAACMTFFVLAPTAFTGHQCTGNYVIFQFSDNVTGVYSIYYFGWLLAGMVLGARWASRITGRSKKAKNQLRTVQALFVGYLAFLVPAAISMTVFPAAWRGIPSVLCGFAVLLALILGLYILPRVTREKHPVAKSRLRV